MVKMIEDFPTFVHIERQRRYLEKHGVKVGIFGTKAEKENEGTKVIEYAVYVEYGTVFMPERPFFRKATQFRSGRRKIIEEQKRILEDVYYNGLTGRQALQQLGIFISEQIKDQIINGSFAPLKQSTIDKKGKNTMLIDSGFMLEAVNFEIVRI